MIKDTEFTINIKDITSILSKVEKELNVRFEKDESDYLLKINQIEESGILVSINQENAAVVFGAIIKIPDIELELINNFNAKSKLGFSVSWREDEKAIMSYYPVFLQGVSEYYVCQEMKRFIYGILSFISYLEDNGVILNEN
ncbi:hypothetical protein BKK50_10540 [Rodentibacter rarus]|uniref:Molecular chaperone Tir n=1 Tax=Rodentibacter rarus TaxID=1908260 RepID=A0A1V3IGI5_9PAST|nr:hypothetical protein [Rodentibacter rarus]OOF39522.1 hypothetical protein BKK50_10540 [Rodentibacter rarus]